MLTVVFACGAPRSAAVAEHKPLALPSASASPPVAVDDGPIVLRELPPLRADVVGKAKTTRVPFVGSSGATVAPDGKTFFIDGRGTFASRGGFIVSWTRTPWGVVPSRSPRGARRALLRGRQAPHGVRRRERHRHGAHRARRRRRARGAAREGGERFDGSVLVTWARLPGLTRAGAPVGPRLCGGADATDDGRVWMVVTPEHRGRPMAYRDYESLTWIDGRTGETRELYRRGGDPQDKNRARGLGDLRLSPKGDFVCFDIMPRLDWSALARRHQATRSSPVDTWATSTRTASCGQPTTAGVSCRRRSSSTTSSWSTSSRGLKRHVVIDEDFTATSASSATTASFVFDKRRLGGRPRLGSRHRGLPANRRGGRVRVSVPGREDRFIDRDGKTRRRGGITGWI